MELRKELLIQSERRESRLRRLASEGSGSSAGSAERPLDAVHVRGKGGGTYEITVDTSGNVVAERVR